MYVFSEPIDAVFQQIAKSLAWRGPGGKRMGHVVLKREEAEVLMKFFGDASVAHQYEYQKGERTDHDR